MARRWIPLPFPECPHCRNGWDQCVHSECWGEIDVEPQSGAVRCLLCLDRWMIWESDFCCSCGHEFPADEIEDALADMLDYCRQIVYELSLAGDARTRRAELGEESMRSFIVGVMEGLGRVIGIGIETVLRFLFSGW